MAAAVRAAEQAAADAVANDSGDDDTGTAQAGEQGNSTDPEAVHTRLASLEAAQITLRSDAPAASGRTANDARSDVEAGIAEHDEGGGQQEVPNAVAGVRVHKSAADWFDDLVGRAMLRDPWLPVRGASRT